ncbi:MAG: nuclear transport factor 2 family protein [Bacteroides sp.]|nr:nuclear transport factor 2 family protein [Bacteroides sp.]
MNRRIWMMLSVLLICVLSVHQVMAVEVIITDGLKNEQLKKKMEQSLSTLLTEVNAAHEEGRNINFASLSLPSDVETTLSMLWENSPFLCLDDVVSEKCLKKSNGHYQIRRVPLLLKAQKNSGVSENDEYQEGVVTFDRNGNIYEFHLSISMHLYGKILKEGKSVADHRCREMILDFTERFRTAYNEHNINFLDAIFSDDALIITGKVIERKTADGIQLPDDIEYVVKSKGEYLKRLKRVFEQDVKNLIHVEFTDIKLIPHPNSNLPEYEKIYYVTLHQKYRSGTYNDDGYLWLTWDFTNEEKPEIHLRAWQPEPFEEGFEKEWDL